MTLISGADPSKWGGNNTAGTSCGADMGDTFVAVTCGECGHGWGSNNVFFRLFPTLASLGSLRASSHQDCLLFRADVRSHSSGEGSTRPHPSLRALHWSDNP
eukprot:353211-Chlamydomonas_euryale.AAC.2